VGIDLSKVGIGLFEGNTKKKRLGPWQKIKLYESIGLGSRLLHLLGHERLLQNINECI